MLMDSLLSKITQLQNRHGGGSLVRSGTTRRLLKEYVPPFFTSLLLLETETVLPD